LAQSEGIFAETAGGVTISALKQLARSGNVKPDEVVVAYITGGGLKTQEAVQDALPTPMHIAPNVEAFEAAWSAQKAVAAS
ncbi:MAG: threonine synthase, partial [Dehalococcoidia bacterium]